MNNRKFKNKVHESAVMICRLHCEKEKKDYIVLEKRASTIKQPGEISLPGGKKEERDKTFLDTAIRETMEELGVKRENIMAPTYYGTFFFVMGVLIETYICNLKVEKISDILYNKEEVEKLLFIPLDFFMKNEPTTEEIRIYNSPLFDANKYKFTERYLNDWHFPNRKIYIYDYEGESIWGMTAEILHEFTSNLKQAYNFLETKGSFDDDKIEQ